MDQSSETLKLSGGHFSASVEHPGLKQLFLDESFDTQREKRAGDEKGKESGDEYTELSIQRIRDLVKTYPEKKLPLFNLINQQMDTIFTKITNAKYFIDKMKELQRDPSEREKQLQEYLAELKKQSTALERIKDLIREDEKMGNDSEVGKKFHSLLIEAKRD